MTIPIIGQKKFTVHNWVSIINGQCDCGAHLQLIGAQQTQCAQCGTLWSLAVLNWNAVQPEQTDLKLRFQKPIGVTNEANPS